MQETKQVTLKELEPLSEKLSYHAQEAYTEAFLPVVAFDQENLKYHVREMDRLLGEVV